MNRSRYKKQRAKALRDPLELRMDKLVESGRQFVDGVAGNRPGPRRQSNRRSINDMGRWVGEKIDWFFEDEEEWNENLDLQKDIAEDIPIKKRPLNAISLRVPKALQASKNIEKNSRDEWPEDETFRVDRWKREESPQHNQSQAFSDGIDCHEQNGLSRRPLPKSSRRRS